MERGSTHDQRNDWVLYCLPLNKARQGFLYPAKLGVVGTCILCAMCTERGGIGKNAKANQLARGLHGDNDRRRVVS